MDSERVEEIRDRLIEVDAPTLEAREEDFGFVENLNGGIGAKLVIEGYESGYFESIKDPENIVQLVREDIPFLLAEVERLREALKFYAHLPNHTDIEYGATAVQKDGGEIARQALSPPPTP